MMLAIISSVSQTSIQLHLGKCNAFAGCYMASIVTLKFGAVTETTDLIEGRLHIPTIKDIFALRVVQIDGICRSVNSEGFTYATFNTGDTLNISGTPAELAPMPGTLQFSGSASACLSCNDFGCNDT